MECSLEIRLFREDDLEDVVDVENNCFPVDQRYSREIFIQYWKQYPELFLVAEYCGRVVGYVIGALIEDMGHIVSIAVHPKHRGRGIGKRLLSAVEKRLVQHGVKYIVLEVAVSNKVAINMYLKHGYRPVTILRKYYGEEDAYLMVKQIK